VAWNVLYTVTLQDDAETWNVQLFRSIDGGAVFGFTDTVPSSPRRRHQGWPCQRQGPDHLSEHPGDQDVYIHAIRRARSFIYIKNQYFLGSSY
jgi:phospholipase D1/2